MRLPLRISQTFLRRFAQIRICQVLQGAATPGRRSAGLVLDCRGSAVVEEAPTAALAGRRDLDRYLIARYPSTTSVLA